jgi:hypothetical protein
MPAYEINGNLPMVVHSDGSEFTAVSYLAQRKTAALAGQVYNPILGFDTIRNVAGHPKYPFNPFYGSAQESDDLPERPVLKERCLWLA